jgi:hypothetical protein
MNSKLPCGCKHSLDKRGREILEQCPTHHQEWQWRHEQAAREYRDKHPADDIQ